MKHFRRLLRPSNDKYFVQLTPAVETWAARALAGSLDYVDRPFLPTVDLGLVLENRKSVKRLCISDLNTFGLEPAALFEIGLRNLRGRSADEWLNLGPNLVRGAWLDSFNAARAALPDVLERAPVHGARVVMIPTQDLLLVAGADDTAAIVKMVQCALNAFDNEESVISIEPWLVTDGKWRRFGLPDALERQIRRRHCEVLKLLYAAQGAVLQKTVPDIHVGELQVLSSPNRSAFTVSTWTEDVDALLPPADVISFVRPLVSSDQPISVLWDDALSVIDSIEAEPGMEPVRYHVDGFPDAEQLAVLRSLMPRERAAFAAGKWGSEPDASGTWQLPWTPYAAAYLKSNTVFIETYAGYGLFVADPEFEVHALALDVESRELGMALIVALQNSRELSSAELNVLRRTSEERYRARVDALMVRFGCANRSAFFRGMKQCSIRVESDGKVRFKPTVRERGDRFSGLSDEALFVEGPLSPENAAVLGEALRNCFDRCR